MDIGAWLLGLGMGRYEAAFRAHDVDAAVLRQLTARDLIGLGVASIGHRRKLLAAIARLSGPAASTPAPAAARAEAERRQLTVMFVDLVGSTALSGRLDPEAMSAVLRGYRTAVAREVGRYEGHVAKLMGDGVLAYFGWPQAHEDDAERSVRAGLATVAAVARLVGGGRPLACRVGIATGLVVVGELVGEGAARERTVVGETPNLAARLQALAKPGQVVVALGTRQLLGRLFALRALRSPRLKGIAEPARAFAVTGAGRTGSRFEARLGNLPLPMVGRERELARLIELWRLARAGAGQAVLITGEAGIGKSRLVHGLREAIAASPHGLTCWQCSPFHRETPLFPVTQAKADGPAAEAATGPGAEVRRQEQIRSLVDRHLRLAMLRPLLVILEDAHWADATTLELAGHLLARLAAAPVLFVIASRDETLPLLPGPPALPRLALGRLGQDEVAAIVAGLAPDPAVAAALRETVLARTDGVPLFVEELTKALAERGPSEPPGTTGVPASLHDTLMARLDRLDGAKEVAQLAACIGREFAYRLLAAIADRPERELRRSLERLCAAELLVRHGRPPDGRYAFKHALVRDVAHGSLLIGRRAAIHARILDAIERGLALVTEEETARHAAQSEQWAKALHHYGLAGRAAIARAAHAEGLGLTDRALAAGAHLAGDLTAEVAMIDLRRIRSGAFLAVGDTPRMLAELRDAEASAGRYGMTRLSCRLRAQRAEVESIHGHSAWRAIRYGQEALRIAGNLRDADLAAAARVALAHAHWAGGDCRAAVAQLAPDAPPDRPGPRTASAGGGGTLSVDGLALLGDCLGGLGRWDEALARGTEARTMAAGGGNPWELSVANHHLARTHLARGDAAAALPLVEWSLDFARRNGLGTALPRQQALLGWVALVAGRPGEALDLLEPAIAACGELQLQFPGAHARLLRAEAGLALGRADAAVLAGEVLELACARGYRAIQVAALRLSGAAVLTTAPAQARDRLAAARELARSLALAPELDALAALERRLGPSEGPVATSA